MDAKELLAQNIVRIRKAENLNQTECARKVNLTRKYLSQLERGQSFPSSAILTQIAEGLQVPISELFLNPDHYADYDIYSYSERALEKILPQLSRMITDSIEKEMVGIKIRKD